MNRTVTSPGIVLSPQLQLAQFFIVFISPGYTHDAVSRGGTSGGQPGPPTEPGRVKIRLFFQIDPARRLRPAAQPGTPGRAGLGG